MRELTIYCLLCPSYHGATLLSLVLGNHSRVLSLGDTIATKASYRCGCGKRVAECDFWQQVKEGWADYAGKELIPSKPELFASPRLNQAAVLGSTIAALRLGRTLRFEQFAKAVRHHLAVCETRFDFDIFIDGYKSISRYTALKAAGFPVRGVIHLIRDPRSFAASSKRKSIPIEKSARQWAAMHDAITRVTRLTRERVLRVRYHELCAEPQQQLVRIQEWMGVTPERLLRPIDAGIHWIGNKSMRNFSGAISARESWRSELSEPEIALVERMTSSSSKRLGEDFFAAS
jgi:hypothetical protein